jgi:hypothetical protein
MQMDYDDFYPSRTPEEEAAADLKAALDEVRWPIEDEAYEASLEEALTQQRAWILHWMDDAAAGLKPTDESLAKALADIESVLSKPHGAQPARRA